MGKSYNAASTANPNAADNAHAVARDADASIFNACANDADARAAERANDADKARAPRSRTMSCHHLPRVLLTALMMAVALITACADDDQCADPDAFQGQDGCVYQDDTRMGLALREVKISYDAQGNPLSMVAQAPEGLPCQEVAHFMGFEQAEAPILTPEACVWPVDGGRHRLGANVHGRLELDTRVFQARFSAPQAQDDAQTRPQDSGDEGETITPTRQGEFDLEETHGATIEFISIDDLTPNDGVCTDPLCSERIERVIPRPEVPAPMPGRSF